jgi:DNA modification methylase
VNIPNYKKRPIGDLTEYVNNSRTHSEEQIQQLMRSMTEFGFTNPIIVDETNTIIAGHGRLEAAKRLNLEEVPVIELHGLTEAKRRAYVIADNKLALNSDWDIDKLVSEVDWLVDTGFDLEITGFTSDEIEGLRPAEIAPVDESFDEVVESAETRVKLGDLWQLGEHYLICGDSTEASTVTRLFREEQPILMVTDPPYGVEYEAGWRAEAKDTKPSEREKTSSLQNDDRADWYDTYSLFPGSVAYVWHASLFTDVVMNNLKDSGFEIKQQIIWSKNIHALSRSDYHWKHEPCWYAVRKNTKRPWYGKRDKMTVWEVSSIATDSDKTAHPTQKPSELYERCIINHLQKGEWLYDPFGGSGTAIIAAEVTERRAYSIELDPKFCDIIIARWEKLTGTSAKLVKE